jgi:uncharacterized Tic20 family protein
MKQLSTLVIVIIAFVLSAGGVLAAGPDDPFAQADAMVGMCSGIFPIVAVLIMAGFMIIVLAKRGQDKRNK